MMFDLAKPVFPVGMETEKNVFVTFRAETGYLSGALLYITAVSFYQVWINGVFVGFGPARTAKGYARVDVLPLERFDNGGKNEIVIGVAGYSVRSLSTVLQPSFLWAEVRRGEEILAYTGRDFTAYLPGLKWQKTERYSVQRHFCEIWDFRAGNTWAPDLAEVPLAVMEAPPIPIERRAPYPCYSDILPGEAKTVGTLRFDPSLSYRESAYSFAPSERWGVFSPEEILSRPFSWVQRQEQIPTGHDFPIPLVLKENEYAIFDFSRIEVGFLLFGAVAAEKTDVILAFSEDSTPDRFAFTNMNAHTVMEYFLPAAQKTEAMSFEPYGMRYCMVAVKKGSLMLEKIGIKTMMHDISSVEIPPSLDSALEAVYRGAMRTFAHNAIDLFMDCPTRERAGWLCDSYFTGKTEYELFGRTPVEDAFLENYSLYENDGELPDGMIPMCYPADIQDDGKYIPQWSMWYILEVEDYINRRGHRDEAARFLPSIEKLLQFYRQYENEDGLLERLPSWNFVEWGAANNWTQDVSFPTNFLYSAVLEAAFRLSGDEHLHEQSREVRRVAIEQSFDGTVFHDHAVRDGNGVLIRGPECSEGGQYYAILFGGVDLHAPEYRALYRLVRDVFRAVREVPCPEITEINAFIGAYLRLEALLKIGEYRLVLRDVEEFFGGMEAETGTLWEYREKKGSRDHGFASYALVAIRSALAGLAEDKNA